MQLKKQIKELCRKNSINAIGLVDFTPFNNYPDEQEVHKVLSFIDTNIVKSKQWSSNNSCYLADRLSVSNGAVIVAMMMMGFESKQFEYSIYAKYKMKVKRTKQINTINYE